MWALSDWSTSLQYSGNHGAGGQTGRDCGMLDAAPAASFPCGGWCPDVRMAEDGAHPLPH